MEIYSLPTLEAGRPKPRCQQGWFPLEAVRETVLASLLAAGGHQQSLGFFHLELLLLDRTWSLPTRHAAKSIYGRRVLVKETTALALPWWSSG